MYRATLVPRPFLPKAPHSGEQLASNIRFLPSEFRGVPLKLAHNVRRSWKKLAERLKNAPRGGPEMPRLLCCRISMTRYSESARSSNAFRRRAFGTFQTHPNPGHYSDRIQEPVQVIAGLRRRDFWHPSSSGDDGVPDAKGTPRSRAAEGGQKARRPAGWA